MISLEKKSFDLNNLKYTNKHGRINKIRLFLPSHQIVTSIENGKNGLILNNEIEYLTADFESLRQEFDFDSHSWILNTYFDKENPDNSILNVAFPSAIAYYYLTLVFPNNDYTFSGKFFENSNYESSLTVYTSDGNLNPDFISINNYNTNLNNKNNVISSNHIVI